MTLRFIINGDLFISPPASNQITSIAYAGYRKQGFNVEHNSFALLEWKMYRTDR